MKHKPVVNLLAVKSSEGSSGTPWAKVQNWAKRKAGGLFKPAAKHGVASA